MLLTSQPPGQVSHSTSMIILSLHPLIERHGLIIAKSAAVILDHDLELDGFLGDGEPRGITVVFNGDLSRSRIAVEAGVDLAGFARRYLPYSCTA